MFLRKRMGRKSRVEGRVGGCVGFAFATRFALLQRSAPI